MVMGGNIRSCWILTLTSAAQWALTSIRTGMESVYTLMDVDRGVPEVWGSQYDIRELLRATYYALDKKTLDKAPLSFKEKMLLKVALKAVKGTDIELLLRNSGLIK